VNVHNDDNDDDDNDDDDRRRRSRRRRRRKESIGLLITSTSLCSRDSHVILCV